MSGWTTEPSLAQEIEHTVHGIAGDFPEVGMDDIFHDCAVNLCDEAYRMGRQAEVDAYWQANYGETWAQRTVRMSQPWEESIES